MFATTALASLPYYALDFPDGPGWLGLFVAIYTLTALGDGRRTLGDRERRHRRPRGLLG